MDRYFSEDGNALYRGNAVSNNQIGDAERVLGVQFDDNYVEFLKRYRGSFVGTPIYGYNNSSMLENIDVVELTKRFREDGWPSSESSYVISIDMSGNPIMIGSDGVVFTYDHDAGKQRVISGSFIEFLEELLCEV